MIPARPKPIIFSGPMVRAILADCKTQTRRVVKPQPSSPTASPVELEQGFIRNKGRNWAPIRCPWKQGDRPWVRETFVLERIEDDSQLPDKLSSVVHLGSEDEHWLIPHYRATEPEPHIVPFDLEDSYDDRTRWSPAIFMPRWASRICLEVTGIRVERLQDITTEACLAEGVLGLSEFEALWNEINGKRSCYDWCSNPWVWVVSFKVLGRPEEAS